MEKRIIKFRSWHKVNKQMEYEGWNERNDNSTYCSKTTLFMYGEDAEIMQFTGLKDKNGKEIYEGDIVDCSGTKYICEWNTHRAEYAWKTLKGNYVYPIGDCRTELEIIGNIYQNPELIN